MSEQVLASNSALGSVLQAARTQKKLSIEDASKAIHLSEKQIHALENNDFSHLPEPAITRGFIRNYANYLEVDVEPLLRQYRSLVPQEEKSIVVKANVNEVMSKSSHQPWLLYVLSSILVLLFLTAWFYYMDSVKAPDAAADAEDVAVTETENLVASMPEEVLTPQEVLAVTAPMDAAVAAQNPAGDHLQNQVPTPQANPATTPVTQQPLVAKKLEMQFSAESWVRVKDKSGQVILEKTATAGSTESLDGEPPFNIIIGNAGAAKVKFYGQNVDLAPATSKNIIRLTLE